MIARGAARRYSRTGVWGCEPSSETLATRTTAPAKLADETKKSYVFNPHVGPGAACTTPFTSCSHPDCLRRAGSKLKSPAINQGPCNSAMAAAMLCNMSRLA